MPRRLGPQTERNFARVDDSVQMVVRGVSDRDGENRGRDHGRQRRSITDGVATGKAGEKVGDVGGEIGHMAVALGKRPQLRGRQTFRPPSGIEPEIPRSASAPGAGGARTRREDTRNSASRRGADGPSRWFEPMRGHPRVCQGRANKCARAAARFALRATPRRSPRGRVAGAAGGAP